MSRIGLSVLFYIMLSPKGEFLKEPFWGVPLVWVLSFTLVIFWIFWFSLRTRRTYCVVDSGSLWWMGLILNWRIFICWFWRIALFSRVILYLGVLSKRRLIFLDVWGILISGRNYFVGSEPTTSVHKFLCFHQYFVLMIAIYLRTVAISHVAIILDFQKVYLYFMCR